MFCNERTETGTLAHCGHLLVPPTQAEDRKQGKKRYNYNVRRRNVRAAEQTESRLDTVMGSHGSLGDMQTGRTQAQGVTVLSVHFYATICNLVLIQFLFPIRTPMVTIKSVYLVVEEDLLSRLPPFLPSAEQRS